MFKNKKKLIFITILSALILILLSSISFYFYNKGSLQYEITKIQESYLNNYSQKKFIKKVLKQVDVYNKDKLIVYINDNFENFLTSNDNLYDFIISYANLYNSTFDLLSDLRSQKVISYNNYKNLKKYLNNLQFDKVLGQIKYVTMKKTNNDILAKKKYFEGVIAQLNFDYQLAQSLLNESIQYNTFNLTYYDTLGNLYNNMHKFTDAINTYEKGLNTIYSSKNYNTKLQLQLLYHLANTYNTINNYFMASKIYNNLLVNAINNHNINYEWLAIYNIASLESKNGNYTASISYLKYALKLANKLKNKQYIAKTLNLLSGVQYLYGDYDSGKRNALISIKYAKQVSDLNILSESSLYACLNYENLKQDKLAKIYCDRSININNTVGKVLNRPEYYIQNANVFYLSNTYKNLKSALDNINMASFLSQKYGLLIFQDKSLKIITKINALLNKTEKAIKTLNISIDLEKAFHIENTNLNNSLFGYIYFIQKDYQKAMMYYQKVLDNAVSENNKRLISMSSSYLAMIYYYLDDYKQAINYSSMSLNENKKMYRYDNYNIEYQQNFYNMLLKIINNPDGK